MWTSISSSVVGRLSGSARLFTGKARLFFVQLNAGGTASMIFGTFTGKAELFRKESGKAAILVSTKGLKTK
jgi:hypothetical protein